MPVSNGLPTQQVVDSLRELAARKRAEADQCDQTAALLERDMQDAAASGRGAKSPTNGRSPAKKPAERAAAKKDAPRRRGSHREAIISLLQKEPARRWTPKDVAAATGINASTVRTSLQALHRDNAISRPDSGSYSAAAAAGGRPAKVKAAKAAGPRTRRARSAAEPAATPAPPEANGAAS
ncbi:MAG: hypothetical protein ACKVWR_00460 [Acidimicrobiales bacterium]